MGQRTGPGILLVPEHALEANDILLLRDAETGSKETGRLFDLLPISVPSFLILEGGSVEGEEQSVAGAGIEARALDGTCDGADVTLVVVVVVDDGRLWPPPSTHLLSSGQGWHCFEFGRGAVPSLGYRYPGIGADQTHAYAPSLSFETRCHYLSRG